VIAACILIQTEAGKAAVAAAALRDLPGVAETASVAGPYDVTARAQARHIGELGKLAASQIQVLGGVTRTMTCPVIHL
jgi:DNA-binding Lrp family transcriptional regulator